MSTRVTVVVTQRERMSLTEVSLENVLADRSEPFRLIYVDGGSADPVKSYLASRVPAVGGLLIRSDEWLWPGVARNLALPHVETPFVAFIDNDVVVEPGWLGKLLKAAEETGAGLVGPLYIVSDGVGEGRIHMAGGTLSRVESDAGVALHEQHDRLNAPLGERAELTRRSTDFVEYHCTLVRTDILRKLGGVSEEIVCVHEHIDLALEVKALGMPVIFEPAAAVTEHAFAPFRLVDLPFHRWRWHRNAVRASLGAFARKWNVLDDDEATKGVRDFTEGLTAALDPLLPSLEAVRPERPLSAADVKQSLVGLLTQARAQGYPPADLELFATAYSAAMSLFAGGFRPCMRPFLNHCVGTASALVAFGFAPRIVVAGMLHAAYSHAPLGPQPHAALTDLSGRLRAAFGERVERLIRAYARQQCDRDCWRRARPLEILTVEEAEVVAIIIANEIDLQASGEAAFAGNGVLLLPEWSAYVASVAATLAIPAFSQTLAALAQESPLKDINVRAHQESFRLVRNGAAPMAHAAFGNWDDESRAITRARSA